MVESVRCEPSRTPAALGVLSRCRLSTRSGGAAWPARSWPAAVILDPARHIPGWPIPRRSRGRARAPLRCDHQSGARVVRGRRAARPRSTRSTSIVPLSRRCAARCWPSRRSRTWSSSMRSAFPTCSSPSAACLKGDRAAPRSPPRRLWPRSRAIARCRAPSGRSALRLRSSQGIRHCRPSCRRRQVRLLGASPPHVSTAITLRRME